MKSNCYDASINENNARNAKERRNNIDPQNEVRLPLCLPDDQFQHVCEFLELSDFLNLSLVSIGANRRVATIHRLSTYREDHSAMSLAPNLAESSSISLATFPDIEVVYNAGEDEAKMKKKRGLSTLLHRFQCLRYLTLCNLSDVDDDFLPILNSAPAASSLVTLALHNCSIFSRSQNRLNLEGNNDMLKDISLTGSIGATYNDFIKSFTSSCNLTSVKLGGCRDLDDEDVSDICQRLSNLEALSLLNCAGVSTPSIRSETMRYLNFHSCSYLTSLPDVHLPSLIHADFSFCPFITDASVQAITSTCHFLKTIRLPNCVGLVSPRIHSASLELVDLSICSGLVSLQMRCDNLMELELCMCPNLHSLTLNIQKMKNLHLNMLPLRQLDIRAPSLIYLNLSGCSSLKDNAVHVSCPNLESLDMCGTELTEDPFACCSPKLTVIQSGESNGRDCFRCPPFFRDRNFMHNLSMMY